MLDIKIVGPVEDGVYSGARTVQKLNHNPIVESQNNKFIPSRKEIQNLRARKPRPKLKTILAQIA
jgi:hypothetical protein